MVELHANLTANGSKTVENGIQPTHHAVHETSKSSRLHRLVRNGFYVFLQYPAGRRLQWVAITFPRLAIPESGIGRSGSASRRNLLPAAQFFSRHLDLGDSPYPRQDMGRWYFSFNPASSALCTARTCTRALSVLDETIPGHFGCTRTSRTKLMS